MNELEPVSTDGVIDITDMPYNDPAEAERVVTRAFELLRTGREAAQEAEAQVEQGRQMLEEAQRRHAWKILGFESWEALMLDGITKHLRHVIDPAVRQRLAVDMRVRDQATLRQIAERFDVSHPTIMRDLRDARAAGELVEEQEPRPTRPAPDPRDDRMSPRTDIAKTWLNHTDVLVRKARALDRLRLEDNRYPKRKNAFLRTLGDLKTSHEILGTIITDLETMPEGS